MKCFLVTSLLQLTWISSNIWNLAPIALAFHISYSLMTPSSSWKPQPRIARFFVYHQWVYLCFREISQFWEVSANTHSGIKSEIASALEVPISEEPAFYLGLPTSWRNLKRTVLAYIREKIKKLDGWKSNVLSQAGREVLIKSLAMDVPAYPMSIFLMPATLCQSINFWWGFSGTSDKVHWPEGLGSFV